MLNPLPGKLRRLPFLLFILFSCHFALAQSTVKGPLLPGCGTVVQREGIYRAGWEAFEKRISQKRLQRLASREPAGTVYTIPVVFHVIHQNGPENIPEIAIRNTLNLLNDAFANRNAYQKTDGVDVEIRFCIAQQMPDGTIQTGITRHESALTDIILEQDDAALKQIGQWDPRSFINIWIVRSINSATNGPGVAGYAYLPSIHGGAADGIVVETAFMNGDADNAKVLIHEMGHYLGLYHTFEGGCKNEDCTTNGDRVCDTPPDGSVAAVPCGTAPNTCTSDVNDHSANNPFRPVNMGGQGDQPDMIRNYMDYGQPQCQDKFTDGQKQRMRDALITARASLLVNTSLCAECNTPITATINVPDVVAAGTPVTFSLTLNNPAVFVNWVIDGQTYTNQSTVTLTFPQAKHITATATITNSNPGCFAQVAKDIEITCHATAAFTASPNDLVSAGETISFTSTSTGTLTWKVDGVAAGTGPSFNYLVPDDKSRLVTLTVDNGVCATVSEPYYVRPDNCSDDKQNNVWFFGELAGLDFNYKPARARRGYIRTIEGSATLCDENGQPLFYSDGTTVGNAQIPVILQNGTNLTGDASTTQSALFVPMPGSDRFVYLFTVAAQAGQHTPNNQGVSYSIIDRQADNGKGAVTKKNIEILPVSLEMITAVKNKRGDGIWVIAHEWKSNAYYSWLVSDTGISSKPVISRTGSVINPSVNNWLSPYMAAIGELKASPTGKRLVIANSGWNFYEVSDFNNETGVISNTIHLENQYTENAYGVAFSPNERYVYGTTNVPATLMRFDLEAGNAAAINNSMKILYENSAGGAGQVQLAPDGKLYVVLSHHKNYLSVIGNPNAANIADCGFLVKGVQLVEYTGNLLGLPNQVQGVNSVKPVIYGPARICRSVPDSLVKYVFRKRGRATYTWSHRGPNQLVAFTDTSTTLRVTANGLDTLILQRTASCATLYDTLIVLSGSPVSVFLGNDTTMCENAYLLKDAGAGFDLYQWSTGDTAHYTNVRAEGWLWVEVTSKAGCSYRDSMMVTWRHLPELNLGNDTSICNAINLTLQAPPGMTSYGWSNGSTGPSLTITDSGTYRVTVQTNNCYFSDTIVIARGIPQQVFNQDTLDLCSAGFATLTVPAGMTAHHWTLPNGKDTVAAELTTFARGWHRLTYANNCGSGEDSVFVEKPVVVPDDKLSTCGDTLLITPLIDLIIAYDITNGQIVPEEPNGDIKVHNSGTYFLFGSDEHGCDASQEVEVLIGSTFTKPAMQVELGNDTAVCGSSVIPLDAGPGFTGYQWSNGGREQTTTAYNAGKYKVTATYCGYTWTDSIQVINSNAISVDLGRDTTLCAGQTVQLNAGSHYDWYSWSNGQSTPTVTLNTTGKYYVTVGVGSCTASDTVYVTACPPPGGGGGGGGGIDSSCDVIFQLKPNPGSYYITLYSYCPYVSDRMLALRVISMDGKEVVKVHGKIPDLNTALNRVMPSLASAMYIVEVLCPVCRDAKQRLKWQIMR
jgi:hypothetical protein